MHSFQWIQGALGIIVALGMTRVIASAVNMCIVRQQVRLDWIPFVWALCIFLLLLQFSWVFVELEGLVPKWTFGVFLLLLGFVLTLFIAAALVLPTSEGQAEGDMRIWYQKNGRWAMPFLALYAFLAYPFNWFLSHQPPTANPASAILIALSLTALWTKSRRVLASVTILDLLLTAGLVAEMVFAGSD